MTRARVQRRAWIVVIGTSAGGMRALREIVGQLPVDFSAPVVIVQHLSPMANETVLVSVLGQSGRLRCKLAEDGDRLEPGQILVARPDHHLLVKKGSVRVTKGARENRSRPAIDSLFRSAAVAYRSSVVGVILTGLLDDGTAGMAAIHACGGTCIVQEPASAEYADMPQSVLDNVPVDHCVPLCEMGPVLQSIIKKAPPPSPRTPPEIIIEAEIAERVLSDVDQVNTLGRQVPYNCPDCGGVLWQITKSKEHRYRCHTGHSFTAASLEAGQLAHIEETLWICLRMLEERKNLLTATARRERQKGFAKNAALQSQRAAEVDGHIERVREMLQASTRAMSAGIKSKH